ncbi:hypothetical protein ACFQ9V_08130 [Leifsonia sp. NPDC056665]|uniref:hypothetical protein n=1 Tax=Leifsonia sp. NPDC056665 TaxID=3345901 RepID=UPI00368F183F
MKVIIFVAGVAVGFMIGSRAGRGTYENMRNKWQGFSGSDQVQQVKDGVRDFAGQAASDLSDKVTEAVGKASDKLDEVTGKKADTTPTEA